MAKAKKMLKKVKEPTNMAKSAMVKNGKLSDRTQPKIEHMIIMDNVSVSFTVLDRFKKTTGLFARPKKEVIHAVKHVSLKVAKGELLVLMGLSGSGKTSLLRTINGLNKISAGSVKVCRDLDNPEMFDVGKSTVAQLREFRQKSIAMVFQQYGLLPWRTVIDNVAFGLELAGVNKSTRHQKAAQMLEMVGLGKWRNAMLSSLSGGMQQRVGLARALALDAPTLLMDEPFSALDPIIRYQLQSELLELNKKLQRTIVFVSHDLDEAMRIADRIAIMKDGQIVQIGTPRDILLNPSNKYVKDFVSEVNPMKVLKARDLVGFSATIKESGGKMVSPDTTYQELLILWRKEKKFFVVADGKKTYGTISGDDLLATLTKN